ncbi:hypothetical protein NP233_g11674 [Leucocoprinus birnbaumii]|uniref:HAT C-terminal dimerisation domain-containing protein n=1 Tax=Leucocoprinus birnbaumii TaxID=56174 RepID=A0AAD5VHX9_9AGAR|nr:hypothetical protein NP233_g11674 [Leucocoprinus birnbaumii]
MMTPTPVLTAPRRTEGQDDIARNEVQTALPGGMLRTRFQLGDATEQMETRTRGTSNNHHAEQSGVASSALVFPCTTTPLAFVIPSTPAPVTPTRAPTRTPTVPSTICATRQLSVAHSHSVQLTFQNAPPAGSIPHTPQQMMQSFSLSQPSPLTEPGIHAALAQIVEDSSEDSDSGEQEASVEIREKKPGHSLKSYAPSTSISILRRHLANCHTARWAQELRRLDLNAGGKEAAVVDDYWVQHGDASRLATSSGMDHPRFTKEEFYNALQEFVVLTNSALHLLEHPKFRALLMLLREDLEDSDIPHRNFLRSCILVTWHEFLAEIKTEVEKSLGKVSLTADIWTDENLTPFIGVTAHRIEVQEINTAAGIRYLLSMRNFVIGFHCVPGRHTGDHLAQALQFIIDRINLTPRMGWVTMDNATNNDSCMESFSCSLQPQTVFDPTERHIRCFPHIVNLACQAVLSEITNEMLTCKALTEIPSQFSTQLSEQFVPLLSVVMAFRNLHPSWSTRPSIDRALKLKQAIIEYVRLNPDMVRIHLLAVDWDTLEVYSKILAVPHAFQQVLSAEKTPTLCDVLPSFNTLIDTWRRLQLKFPAYRRVIEAGVAKLERYRDRTSAVPAYTLAILINPSMRLDWFRQNTPSRVDEVRELFIRHLEPYHREVLTSTRVATTVQHPGPGPSRPDISDISDDDDPCAILGLQNLRLSQPGGSRSLHAEVEAYFLDTQVASTSLLFWQASSVPCERLFSTAKETMTPRRSRIGADLMEALQMLKYAYDHGGEVLDFTSGLNKDNEAKYLLQLDREQTSVPEDINLYIESLHAD